MDHKYTAEYDGILIRPLIGDDIENLRIWRNDAGNSKYLRPVGEITPEMQKKWFEDYLTDTNIITFAIEEQVKLNCMVGSVSLYNLKDEVPAVGKIVIGDSTAHGIGAGFKGWALAICAGFEKLNIKSFFTAANQDNIKSNNLIQRLGFKMTGEHPINFGIGKEYHYTMTKDEFYACHPEFEKIPINSD